MSLSGPAEPGRARSLAVLTGPAAAGRGAITADVRARYPEVRLPAPVTTRPPRPGEAGLPERRFVTEAEFDDLAARGELVEWAVVHGRHRYGTPRGPIDQALRDGAPALLAIDVRGARRVRHALPGAFVVLLSPRPGDGLAGSPDATVVNDDVHRATDELVQCLGLAPRPLGPVRG